ncbi:hypothetical protein J5X91_17275 [Pseudoalteromonas sp. K222D]|nr:hypothetical protein [Pseudoalteromonas sp. K222D]MBO7927995.1 hypothetical protein [Pseudoalteromonas sp. K222D]
MDANTTIIIAINLCGFAATIATLKNDINWLKAVIDKQDKRIEKLEEKLC